MSWILTDEGNAQKWIGQIGDLHAIVPTGWWNQLEVRQRHAEDAARESDGCGHPRCRHRHTRTDRSRDRVAGSLVDPESPPISTAGVREVAPPLETSKAIEPPDAAEAARWTEKPLPLHQWPEVSPLGSSGEATVLTIAEGHGRRCCAAIIGMNTQALTGKDLTGPPAALGESARHFIEGPCVASPFPRNPPRVRASDRTQDAHLGARWASGAPCKLARPGNWRLRTAIVLGTRVGAAVEHTAATGSRSRDEVTDRSRLPLPLTVASRRASA